jgi:hypothetical protein
LYIDSLGNNSYAHCAVLGEGISNIRRRGRRLELSALTQYGHI